MYLWRGAVERESVMCVPLNPIRSNRSINTGHDAPAWKYRFEAVRSVSHKEVLKTFAKR